MREGADLSPIAGDFYEAAADATRWEPALAGLLRLYDGTSGSLMIQEPGAAGPELLAMPGFSDDALRLYADYYHQVDLWASFGRLHPTLRGVLGQRLVADADFERSEVWNDYSRFHVGAFHLLGAVFDLGGGRMALLGLHRPRDAVAFDEEDRRRLDRLLPHLQRALQLQGRLGAARGEAALGRAALDALRHGVVVVDRDGVALLANRAAEALARDGGALSLGRRGQAIAAARPEETRRLLALLRDAAEGGAGGALLLPRPAGGAPVAALAAPLPPDLGEGAPRQAAALLILRDLGRETRGLAAILTGLFGLTQAEADLACVLAGGKRPDQIAAERGVKITTVRSQLSALLNKTGARRQSELVALLERIVSAFPAAP